MNNILISFHKKKILNCNKLYYKQKIYKKNKNLLLKKVLFNLQI